ncbi:MULTISPECIES: hypothetical protein [unclassified Bradyrhizobium]|nr:MULTISPECIES: hypothetical protein [unclassified Bradyrhizobium]MBB4256909.1 hypothetical protein [Bradyrhizobium sp. CIR3A]NYG43066.1 hypothetical protein [Bradyrhizobium sp. IAR9]
MSMHARRCPQHVRALVDSSYTMGLDAGTAQLLQKAAWETVQDYYGR